MPRPKSYAPIDHLINSDAEVWAFTEKFGDRSLRTLVQVIINLDKTENRWRLTGDWAGTLSRLTRQLSASVRRQVDHMLAAGWLVPHESAADGSPVVLGSPNYGRFHRSEEHKKVFSGSTKKLFPVPTTNQPKQPTKEEDKEKSADAPLSFPKSENLGLGESDPSVIVGPELWGRLEAMWREKGKRLSIYEREAIGLQLRELQQAGQDPARVVRKALQGGWLHLHPLRGKELPDTGETLEEIKARVLARNGGANGKTRLQ